MTNDQLLFEVGAGLERGNKIAQEAWLGKAISRGNAEELVNQLRVAMAAAMELARRAARLETHGDQDIDG